MKKVNLRRPWFAGLLILSILQSFSFGICPVGDLDGDCAVGITDLVIFADYWLDDITGGANLDSTGTVDIADFAILADHWGDTGYRLVINEFMADNAGTIQDPDDPGQYPDWIEIYNYGATAVNIGGMYLTDDLAIPNMSQIPTDSPAQTTIAPGRYLLIWADGEPLQGPLHVDFKLGASGEEVGLFDANGNLIDGKTFGSQTADESYGRLPDGGSGWQKFDNATASPGTSNGGTSTDAGIVISEIMYHPAHDELTFEPEPITQEYIELHNRGISAVDLSGWQFVNGVAFTIPQGATIEANSRLVIAADLTEFTAKYPAVTNVVGGWTGKLSNQGEKIELTNALGTIIDSVTYSDQGDWAKRLLGPIDHNHRGWIWSDAHDGAGQSLELISATTSNEYGQNWKASTTGSGTPGQTNSVAANISMPIITNVEHYPAVPASTDTVTVTAKIINGSPDGLYAVLRWRVDTSVYIKDSYTFDPTNPYNDLYMYDDGLHDDGQAGDGIYGAQIPQQADGDIIEFYIEVLAMDLQQGDITVWWPAPCDVEGMPADSNVANLLYQVDDDFTTDAAWTPGKQPIYYIIMTEAERGRNEEIGAGDTYERYSDAQMNTTFISVDGIDTKVRYNTGARNRGEGSRRNPPNNFRINFKHDDPWKGVTGININSKYTHLQLAGSAIFRMADLPAAQGTAVQVRVNGQNLALTDSNPARMYGTYVHLEAIDSDFASDHFPDDADGNIYKASIYPQVADLTYLGTDPALYIDDGYSKGTNGSANDWSDLFDLTNVLENEPDETYLAELNRVVNVDQWIHWYAVQALVGNNETNLGTGYGDDYRMYAGITDPRFLLITHDMDTILGDGDNPAGIDDSIWRCVSQHSSVQMAVIERFLQHPQYVGKYYAELQKVANTIFAPENINPLLDEVLGGFVPNAKLDQLKQYAANHRASVLSQIPTAFTAAGALPVVNGYYQTTLPNATVNGTANAIETRAVTVNGQLATWDGVLGTWSFATGDTLQPGINRLVVQTYNDPNALGDVLEKEYVDVWYNDGDESIISGTLAVNTTLDAASGPWHVTGQLVIPTGITLTIEPDATLFFDASTGITVNGRLNAQGSEYARIMMTRVPGQSSWYGLNFTNTLEDNRLTYLDMEFGDTQGESIMVDASKITIDNMAWVSTNGSTRIIELSHPSALICNSILPSISGTEPAHGVGLSGNEYLIFQGNTFGSTSGYNDIVDFSGGQRPGPIIQFYNNTFLGGGDDGPDLDGTDAHVEGNLFKNFHKTTPDQDSPSYAVATGYQSQVCIVRNVFVNNDHAILQKEDVYSWTQNNTIVNSTVAAISFGEPFRSSPRDPGKGTYLDSNIFWNNEAIFQHYFDDPIGYGPTGPVNVYRNLLSQQWHSLGSQNIDADPILQNPLNDWTLLAASPAIATGSNGQDMGAFVPAGASISGQPYSVTHRTAAEFTVSGPGITHYKYRLIDNGQTGSWSSEIELPINADDSPADPANIYGRISLTGLQNGHTYSVEVTGKNSAGHWQGTQFRDTDFIASGNIEGNSSAAWTVDTASQIMVINEVLARNAAAIEHEGTYPDMIELYYDGPSAIDLSGYSLTDNIDLPTKFVFATGTTMTPGQYLTIYADALPTSGLHTGFELTGSGDDVYLFDNTGQIIDSVTFGNQLEGMSFGRVGYDSLWALTDASFGNDNIAAPLSDPADLRVNEWLANGEILFSDDWIEIYNPGLWPVNMGDMYLTDNPAAKPDKHQLRPLTFVDPQGFAVFKADSQTNSGHVNFNLSADGEIIALYDAALTEIDKVIYAPQMTDVSQGRAPNGSDTFEFFNLPTPGVSNADVSTIVTVDELIQIDNIWSYEQSGTDLGTTWRDPAYDDSAWPTGAGLLYVEGSSLPAPKSTPLTLGKITYYFRKHFTFNGDPSATDTLDFATVIDDGAIIYLNGNEVLRFRITGDATYDTRADDPAVGNASYEGFSIPTDHLITGDNVIAVEVHQVSSNSSDIVFGLELDAVTTTINIEDTFAADIAVLNALRITEIMYNSATDPNTEFIELKNTGPEAIDLTGVRFTNGIDFTFPAMTLEPGQYTVVVANTAIFQSRYGSQINIAGQYLGSLSDAGESIVLKLAQPLDAAVMRFDYADGWYTSTDGQGNSLVIVDPQADPVAWQYVDSWRQSVIAGGSPGREDIATVIINEVLAHSHAAAPDWIELYNASDATMDISGWYLSDDADNLQKYQIASAATIAPDEYAVFYQDVHFGNASDPGSAVQFGLSENGETVYLSSAENNQLTGYTVEVTFSASETDIAFGRYTKSDSSIAFVPMAANTPNAPNAAPKVGPVVISEIMYNPAVGGSYAAEDYEFIELKNITASPITLDRYDAELDVTLGWQFENGIDFTFPLGTTIPANGYLIVAKNPTAFAERYGVANGATVLGPFANATKLSNSGEQLTLAMPGDTDAQNVRHYITIDTVQYNDDYPWPASPDGNGNSLTRINTNAYADDTTNWQAATPQPGM